MYKQKGGRIVLPSEYFGKTSGRYYTPGSNELIPSAHACGPSNAVSFPNTDLGPMPNHSGVQTGGGDYLQTLYNYIVGNSKKPDIVQNKKNNQNQKRKKNKQNQKGGRVSLPAEYFGNNSGRYYNPGSPQLVPEAHACGPTNAVNFPYTDLGPMPNHSGVQTGGFFWPFDSEDESKKEKPGEKSIEKIKSKKNKQNKQNKQNGGEKENYSKINNPVSGKNVDVKSKEGQQIIQNYLNTLKNKYNKKIN